MAELSIDEILAKPEHELTLKDVLMGMKDLKQSFELRLTKLEQEVKEIQTVRQDVDSLRQQLEETTTTVESLMTTEEPFPPATSIILSNLPKPDDEDDESLLDAVNTLIQEGMGLDDIQAQAVLRTKPRSYAEAASGEERAEERPGVIKVRLWNVDQKIRCLRKKRNLRQHDEYKSIYVRAAEDHATRLARINMNTLLQGLQMRDRYTFSGSGRLIKKNSDNRDNQITGDESTDMRPPERRNTRSQAAGSTHQGDQFGRDQPARGRGRTGQGHAGRGQGRGGRGSGGHH